MWITYCPKEYGEFPAYFNQTVYYCDQASALKAFGISNAKLTTSPTSSTAMNFGYPGVLPAVSANGTSNGIVWAIENSATAVLHAFAANNLANELYNSNQARQRRTIPAQGINSSLR